MDRSWGVIGQVLLYTIVGLVVAGAVGTAVTKKPFLLAPIRSNSMYPLMERGDAVIIYPVAGDQVSVGDIVIFRPQGGSLGTQAAVIHRLISGDRERGFVSKGDANEETDQRTGAKMVQAGDIQAKPLMLGDRPLRIRLMGYPSLWLEQYQSSPYALPSALGVVMLLLVVTEVKGRGQRVRRAKATPAYVIYPAAGLAVAIILSAAQIAGSSFLTLNYEVSETGRGVMMGSAVGVLQKGDVFTRELSEVGGKGFLPMVCSVTSPDPQLTFSKRTFVTKPGMKEKLSVTVHADKPGDYSSKVSVGMFLPTLPPSLIHRLAGISFWPALAAVSFVPALPLLLWPLVDTRMRRQLARATRRRFSQVTQRIMP